MPHQHRRLIRVSAVSEDLKVQQQGSVRSPTGWAGARLVVLGHSSYLNWNLLRSLVIAIVVWLVPDHHCRSNRASDPEGREFVFLMHLHTVSVSRVPVLSPSLIPLLISPSLFLSFSSRFAKPQIWMKRTVAVAKRKPEQPLVLLLPLIDVLISVARTHTQRLSDRNRLLALALCRLHSHSKLDSNQKKISLAEEKEENDRETDKDSELKLVPAQSPDRKKKMETNEWDKCIIVFTVKCCHCQPSVLLYIHLSCGAQNWNCARVLCMRN